jgi:CheY-like chemotaxis protein
VQVTLERVDSHVEIVVRDTGKGIRADFLPRLFERFQQAETGSSRSYGGLGLGLAIVRHIVELHGGTVVAASEGEDKGATFTVKLPRILSTRPGAEPGRRHPTGETGAVDADTPRLDGVRILVVDDEPDSNEVVRAVFTLAGAEVRVAVSAADALTEIVRWHPDVLVSDIGMPVEDGYTLLRRVRRLEGEVAHTPAVALTAYGTTEDRVRIFSAGFQAHVVKPIEPAELTAVVASTVRRLLLPRSGG